VVLAGLGQFFLGVVGLKKKAEMKSLTVMLVSAPLAVPVWGAVQDMATLMMAQILQIELIDLSEFVNDCSQV
jgi:hypothetical protein